MLFRSMVPVFSPEKWWMLHPWQCSWLGEMGFWATWSSGWHPCPGRGLELDDLYDPFQPKPCCGSVIVSSVLVQCHGTMGVLEHSFGTQLP